MVTKKIIKSITDSPDKTQELVDMFFRHTEDSKWMRSNLAELRAEFPDRYVAVRNKEVIMHDKDHMRLIRRLREDFDDIRDITIDYITDRPTKLLV